MHPHSPYYSHIVCGIFCISGLRERCERTDIQGYSKFSPHLSHFSSNGIFCSNHGLTAANPLQDRLFGYYLGHRSVIEGRGGVDGEQEPEGSSFKNSLGRLKLLCVVWGRMRSPWLLGGEGGRDTVGK